ncbi:MAG: hypothetical protein REI95_00460 [Oxalicibacterium faecigallinarum]|uniref:Uncharacterized protein n=2 Tax=Oxalicibacterium faecigallinarum TaxID=573741 RepID=A0A8J3AU18_9BURK|nr:hypothetical protein [Oxalicibacterium faecigallinarum]MDQ7968092.1 hypothetical protein [Oxalicibacterium faecigallinarum]GGI19360.1 hypothetical protein GCM10008066_18690 [Oxalicibacterium faecigallinarum]
MYAWLLPTIKAILPHVGTIITAAQPMFKSRKVDKTSANSDELILQDQISELQNAASQNAGNIQELAQQLQQTVMMFERAAIESEKRYRRLSIVTGTALVAAVVSLGMWMTA